MMERGYTVAIGHNAQLRKEYYKLEEIYNFKNILDKALEYSLKAYNTNTEESFVCYTEWLQYFDMLKTDAERAEIARAMFLYNIDGTVPDKSTHSTSFMVLFAMMKNQFDRDNEKYQKNNTKIKFCC